MKVANRLLREKTNTDGSLDPDRIVSALLMKRNTSDPQSQLSHAEDVFGRKLKDVLPYGGHQAGPLVQVKKDINNGETYMGFKGKGFENQILEERGEVGETNKNAAATVYWRQSPHSESGG